MKGGKDKRRNMTIELIHVGFGNVLAINRVIAIAPPNSAPTKRMAQEGKSTGMLIDLTNGRRTKAVLVMDSGHIVLAAIAPETIAGRLTVTREG
ncbi:Extracellular matrix regulatory protein A [subsurface metagenome]